MERAGLLNISRELVEQLDGEVGRAIRDVELGSTAKATAVLSFDVGLDEDGEVLVVFSRKNGRAAKGSWSPPKVTQGRFDMDDSPTSGGGQLAPFRESTEILESRASKNGNGSPIDMGSVMDEVAAQINAGAMGPNVSASVTHAPRH